VNCDTRSRGASHEFGVTKVRGSAAMQAEITQGSITRVLVAGFTLVIVLLGIGGGIALKNVFRIQQTAIKLVSRLKSTRGLIENLQDEQQALSRIFYTLTGDPDTADAATIKIRLDQALKQIHEIESGVDPVEKAKQPLWRDLEVNAQAFSNEALRLIRQNDMSPAASRDLFRHHEHLINTMNALVNQGFQSVQGYENEINRRSTELHQASFALLGVSVALALVCSIVTVGMTRELFRNMAWQEGELTRVSWQMLSDQESIARRFSHELHDELGQTLAALRANLGAMSQAAASSGGPSRRLEDSMRLTDDAIRNVRQLSQLLRPLILDDFGLDAGLSWLCDGFTERTGIAVEYDSNLHSRLPDETETHLFRIAQEALTNVARHSGATKVNVALQAAGGQIRLSIADNGKGIQEPRAGSHSLGMTGMRARARVAGGVFRVESPKEGGLTVEAEIPLPEEIAREEHESHSHIAG
jgi:signal transduction histidine kinase